MPRNTLTHQQKAAIRKGYAARGAKALAAELRVPLHLVKNLVHREALRRDPAHCQRRPFTDSDRTYLQQHYPHRPTAQLAQEMGREVKSVYSLAMRMGLKKSAAYLATEASGRMFKGDQRGKHTRFLPGQTSHNKGKPMPKHVYEKVKRTMFKPGNRPHNTKFDGYVSVRRDKDGRQYLMIRTAKGTMVPLHRHLWEQANGPVPAGYRVYFKDGNQGNCVLHNLEMLSHQEMMLRNTIQRYPKEIQNVMRILAKLNRTIKRTTEPNDHE